MENDPELNGKYLGTITKDFVVVSDTLKEASYQIRKRGFSDFPIFPISKVEIPVGNLLVGRGEMATVSPFSCTRIRNRIWLLCEKAGKRTP